MAGQIKLGWSRSVSHLGMGSKTMKGSQEAEEVRERVKRMRK
jgi:hypothetical protein